MTELWAYRTGVDVTEVELIGFDVEARDGHIGKIDESSVEAGDAYLVVDTGFWIFGKKRLIPARAVRQVNTETGTVYVDLDKDEIKDAPDFEAEVRATHRDPHAGYYDRFTW
jgi:hypothetical protein